MNLTEIGCVTVDWIKLAEDMIQGHVSVNSIINLVQLKAGNFMTSVRLSVSEEGFCFMELIN